MPLTSRISPRGANCSVNRSGSVLASPASGNRPIAQARGQRVDGFRELGVGDLHLVRASFFLSSNHTLVHVVATIGIFFRFRLGVTDEAGHEVAAEVFDVR